MLSKASIFGDDEEPLVFVDAHPDASPIRDVFGFHLCAEANSFAGVIIRAEISALVCRSRLELRCDGFEISDIDDLCIASSLIPVSIILRI